MEAKRIDIEDWVLSGGGGNGLSYFHKEDDSVMLKLNKTDIPAEKTYEEYLRTKAVYESGIRCPAVYDFVTDGERFGMTVQRVKDKKSFVRIISEDPSQLEPLAKDFARRSREFHSVRCDTSVFPDNIGLCCSRIRESAVIPDDVKDALLKRAAGMERVDTCLHGDFQPGNIIRAHGQDYWIDLGDFGYGDPDFDMGSLLMIAKYTPAKVVEYLFHMSRKDFARFVEIYGQEYYGSAWHSAGLDSKLQDVIMLKIGRTIALNPRTASIYMPVLRGQKFRAAVMMWIVDHVVKSYN